MDLIPGTALALMPLPLVIQYRVKAGELTIGPSQTICVRASRPGLNEIPFQVIQLFANHNLTPVLAPLNGKKVMSLPDFGSCFVMRAKRNIAWSRNLCSSRLLDVVFPGLRCGGQVHFCDVYGVLVWINMGPHSHIMSFMALKGLRVIHIPGSLVGYELKLSPS